MSDESKQSEKQKPSIVPWIVFGLCTLLFAVKPVLSPPKVKEGFDYLSFGKLPVLLGGRVKPLDSVARTSLLQIAGQQRIALEGNGPKGEWDNLYKLHQAGDGRGLTYRKFYQFNKRPKKLHPTEWLMEVLMKPDVADRRFIFRIDHPELLGELQLEETGVDMSGLRFYTFEQMRPNVLLLHRKKQVIGKKDAATRTPYERAAFKLAHALEIYIQLRYSLQPNRLDLDTRPNADPPGVADYARLLRQIETDGADYAVTYSAFLKENEGVASTIGLLFYELRRFGDITQADLDNADPNHLVTQVRARLENLLATNQQRLEQMPEAQRAQFMRIAFAIRAFLAEPLKDQAKLARHLLTVEAPFQAMKERSSLFMIPTATDDPTWDARQWKVSVVAVLEGKPKAYELPRDLGHWENSKWETMLDQIVDAVGDSELANPTKSAWTDAEAKAVLEFAMGKVRKREVYSPDPNWEPFDWHKTADAILAGIPENKIPPPAHHYAEMSSAYVGDKPEAFNAAVKKHSDWLSENGFAIDVKKGSDEHFFNTFAPFARAQGIYVIALLLACFSWLKMSRGLSDTAFYLIGLALVLHTAGLIFRMVLEGRPPVTNLYSSAIFVGWGAVLLGWVLERIYRNGIGSCVSAMIGFSTLIIAAHLSKEGDTMEMMRAVLDTNFWLATHVVCITIGYAATFLAGFLALVYVLRGVFTPSLTGEIAKGLARMVYGIVCFATLFSFVGTVLGGIWADQSWGRFWGWDTKENGALMIVVWNAIILHCRWGGLVRDRGLIVLALFGNIVTAWSWFGVNMLGIGLHSYGFMDEAFNTLRWFAITQVLFMLVARQPIRNWLSGGNLGKEYNGPIAKIVAVMMGLGLLLHLGSLWTTGFLSYLGIALVGAGLLLSFLPVEYTASPSKKSA